MDGRQTEITKRFTVGPETGTSGTTLAISWRPLPERPPRGSAPGTPGGRRASAEVASGPRRWYGAMRRGATRGPASDSGRKSSGRNADRDAGALRG